MKRLLLVCAACHHDPAPQSPQVAKLREFRDRACACKTTPCVDDVQQDLIAWAAHDTSQDKPSDADTNAADALVKEFQQCVVAAGGKL